MTSAPEMRSKAVPCMVEVLHSLSSGAGWPPKVDTPLHRLDVQLRVSNLQAAGVAVALRVKANCIRRMISQRMPDKRKVQGLTQSPAVGRSEKNAVPCQLRKV
jgi:hypothetical protein